MICLDFSFELEVFVIVTMKTLVDGFGGFVTASQDETLYTMITHGYQIVADVLDVRFNLFEWNFSLDFFSIFFLSQILSSK